MTCDTFHCENGYLPLLPDESALDNRRDTVDGVPLLWAVEYVGCPCSADLGDHIDIGVDPLDLWRVAPECSRERLGNA